MFGKNPIAKWLLLILIASALRLTSLNILPNGYHWDELDGGYQARSLLKTGKDYFGNILPLFPHSFAEYRTPVLIYSLVPVVNLPLRTLPAIFGILGVVTFGLLVYFLTKNYQLSTIGVLVMSLSVWHIQYSRQALESIVMSLYFLLGLATFLRGKYKTSALLFGLSMFAYATAKMFVPLFVVFLVLTNLEKIKKMSRVSFLLSTFIFLLLSGLVVADGVFGKSGQRFRELSIFTNPTTAADVNVLRQTQQQSSGNTGVGLQPRLIDKIIYNKATLWGGLWLKNYISAFSTDFLFVRGDNELRHSPKQDDIGMLYLIEIIPFIIGIYVIAKTKNWMLAFWLIIGAIPASLTRSDNPHAARLFIILPALLLTIALGIHEISKKSKLLLSIFYFLLSISAIFTFSYYFSIYRWESALPFQYGFDQAVRLAVANKDKYDRVILDGKHDSLLMAYLYYTKFDPAKFQAMLPLSVVEPYSNVRANQIDNIYLLLSGEKVWKQIWADGETGKKTLLIVSSKEPDLEVTKYMPPFAKRLEPLLYPNSTTNFYVIEGR